MEQAAEQRTTEEAQAIVARHMGRPGFGSYHGFEVVAAEVGTVTLAVRARPDLTHLRNYFHGGAVAGLAEQAAAACAATILPEDQIGTTTESRFNYHRAVMGTRLYATARVVSATPALVVAEVRIEAESLGGRGPCGTALITMRALPFTG